MMPFATSDRALPLAIDVRASFLLVQARWKPNGPRRDGAAGIRLAPIVDLHRRAPPAMDSINAQQPEKNHEDVSGKNAVERIQAAVKKSDTCFFCTAVSAGGSGATRPMSVQDVDDQGNLWFLSAKDSHKNREIARQPDVRLFFQGSGHAGFLALTGTATISTDKKKIEELWEPIVKTWFTGGKDDPRITVIRVKPTGGYYWDNKHGALIAGAKMLVGAATGKTLDDSIEGRVTP